MIWSDSLDLIPVQINQETFLRVKSVVYEFVKFFNQIRTDLDFDVKNRDDLTNWYKIYRGKPSNPWQGELTEDLLSEI